MYILYSLLIMEEIRNLKRKYKNSRAGDNIGDDFISPCLKYFKSWRRCTLGFSSSALKTWAGSLARMVSDDIKIEILCDIGSCVNDKMLMKTLDHCATDEEKAITLVKHNEQKILLAAFAADISKDDQEGFKKKYGWQLLHWLIASEKLILKFAVNTISDTFSNLYHEKSGYFTFQNDITVAHYGTFNESESGHRGNNDSVMVYSSYRPDQDEDRILTIEDTDSDWNGNDSVKVYSLSRETLKKIKESAPKTKPEQKDFQKNEDTIQIDNNSITPSSLEKNCPKIPELIGDNKFDLRRHQERAYDNWINNKGNGIFWHVTGSGKTITALYTLSKVALNNDGQKIIAIIQIPTTPLADQWVDELKNFNLTAIQAYGDRNKWESELKRELHIFKQKKGPYVLPIIVLDKTFSMPTFQKYLKEIEHRYKKNVFYICDECHRFAKKDKTKHLPNAVFKIGLSGSPFSTDDGSSIGDIEILKYFGGVSDTYDIRDALDDGVLTPYEYIPIKCYLNENEYNEIKDLELKIAQSGVDEDGQLTQAANIYSSKRNRVLADVEDKFRVFTNVLQSKQISENKSKTLFFVGDGSTEIEINLDGEIKEKSIRVLDKVRLITNNQGWQSMKFTCDESPNERKKIIKDFSDNFYDALIAIRVLDEGIDIPGIQNAFLLASTSNKRQFIQRRGRILRKAENKDKSYIYDFIVLPPKDLNCSYLKREIIRLIEIGKDCTNKEITVEIIKEIISTYDVKDEALQLSNNFIVEFDNV